MNRLHGTWAKAAAATLALLFPATMWADTVTIPFGTTIYCQLDQRVTSKRKHNKPGELVKAHVWRDVTVNGRTVVKAGTPVFARIGEIKPAKVAGVKGRVEVEVMSVASIDGRDVPLTGGYDQSGKSLTALSVALAAVVFVPLIFIKGKQAKLEPGLIFDAMVQSAVDVSVEGNAPIKLNLGGGDGLDVAVMYEQIDPEGKMKTLPLKIDRCGSDITDINVTQVNGTEIQPIPIEVQKRTTAGECQSAQGTVDLASLGKHFTKGINRFFVDADGETSEVVLEVEL